MLHRGQNYVRGNIAIRSDLQSATTVKCTAGRKMTRMPDANKGITAGSRKVSVGIKSDVILNRQFPISLNKTTGKKLHIIPQFDPGGILAIKTASDAHIIAYFKHMTVEAFGTQLSVDVTVSDDDLQQFYNANKDKFVIPDSVLVSHILIAVDPKSTDDQKKKLEVKAQGVLKQALSSGADFGALAQQYSDDKATATKGGSLGYLVKTDKGSWKPIVDAAFAAPPGKVIPHLVQSDFGFHIVKPVEMKPGRTLALDEVRDDVKNVVLHQKVEARINSEVAKLRAAATIKTYL